MEPLLAWVWIPMMLKGKLTVNFVNLKNSSVIYLVMYSNDACLTRNIDRFRHTAIHKVLQSCQLKSCPASFGSSQPHRFSEHSQS